MDAKHFFEIKQSGPRAKTRQFWFRLVCENNGEIMFTGERHPTKAKAKRALARAINVTTDGDWEFLDA